MGQVFVVVRCCYSACLLAHHDGQSIRLLTDAPGGTMPEAKLLGDIQVVTDGQDAGCRRYLSAGDYHGTIVQWGILEKDVLNEALGNLCLYSFAGADEIAQGQVVLHHYERAGLLLAHIQASHQYGHNGITVVTTILVESVCRLWLEELEQTVDPLMGTNAEEEMSDFLLKKDNDGDSTHTDQLVQYAAQQLHLQDLADQNPDTDEDKHALEDIHRARLLHQLVAEEQHYRHKENVYKVL